MTEQLICALVASIAAVLGAFSGYVFAVEGRSRAASILAAGYMGGGAGLASALPSSSLLMLAAQLMSADSLPWLEALDATGTALMWGIAGGVAGGLLMGCIVAVFKRYRRPA